MSNRYEYYLGTMSIKDNETNKVYDYVADLLNEQDQKIKELEHRLSNSIEPKFKVGDKCWFVYNKQQKFPFEFIVSDFSYYGYRKHKILYDSENSYEGVPECCLFSTLEEAEKNLKEMQNETTK